MRYLQIQTIINYTIIQEQSPKSIGQQFLKNNRNNHMDIFAGDYSKILWITEKLSNIFQSL